MPFKKQGKDDYTSPSGRHYNAAQVRLYYAHGGKFPSHEGGGPVKESLYPKGYAGRTVSYASGGAVLGRVRDFLKTPDRFRENQGKADNFGKGESKANPEAKDKSLAVVKPQKGAGY